MPPTKTWKSRERQIARLFGAERTPLSGGSSGHTRGDIVHPAVYVEHKHRRRHPVLDFWRTHEKSARKGGFIPALLAEDVTLVRLSKAALQALASPEGGVSVLVLREHQGRAVRALYAATAKLAALEGKVAMVTLSEHRKQGAWAVLRLADAGRIAEEMA